MNHIAFTVSRRGPLRMLAVAVVLSLSTLCVAVSGCDSAQVAGGGEDEKDEKPRLSITSMEVKGLSTLSDKEHAALKGEIRSAVASSSDLEHVTFAGAGAIAADAELVFELLSGREEGTALHLEILIEGEDDHGSFAMRAESWSSVSAMDDPEQLSRAIDLASKELVRQVDAGAVALLADDDALSDLLEKDSSTTLVAAVREVQRRGYQEATGEVRSLLFHPEKEVVLVAVATLGQLGDRESVPPIRDLMTSPDDEKVRQAIFALGSIGGDDALDALGKVAKSHPDPGIRGLATEAFMKARENSGGADFELRE